MHKNTLREINEVKSEHKKIKEHIKIAREKIDDDNYIAIDALNLKANKCDELYFTTLGKIVSFANTEIIEGE